MKRELNVFSVFSVFFFLCVCLVSTTTEPAPRTNEGKKKKEYNRMRRLVDFCKRVQGNNMTKMPPLSDRLPCCLKKKKTILAFCKRRKT